MASKIILKKSSVAAKAPVAGDLEFGELAINYTDSKLYFKKADGSIDAFTSAAASAPVTSVGGNIGAVTDAQLLASIKNVDGTGSGLDADFLDGLNASAFYLASNPNGYTSNTGTVTSVGATAPLVSSGGTAPSISIPAANSTTNGYMSSAYAAKLDGIAAGATNVTNNNQLTNGAGYITSAALASYLPLTGGSLTGPLNVNRRRLSFSSSYNDANHSIYNNYENIDGEGIWDGMKMNVYEGLRVRVGNASGVTPTTILALSSSSVRINTQLQVGQNTNGTATIDAYNGFAWFGRDSNTTGIRIDGSGNVHTTAALNSVGALTQNGNQVLHAGNYTSYSPSLTGGGASGTWSINITGNAATATTADQIDSWPFRNTGSNSGTNADTIESNGITYYTAGVTNFSGNSSDGALYSQFYSSSWQHQIAGDYRSGQIAVRGKNNGTWQSWRKILQEDTWQGSKYFGSDGAIYGTIFYDANNGAYFVDPAGRSRQSQIDFGDGGYYIHGGSWGMRNTTPYGYIEFGPANSGHAHIYTDRSNFYFNAQIQVLGGSNINQSDIRANIFYDQQDTGYYADLNSGSNLNQITSNQCYVNGWFRNNASNTGLYNQATTQHWSSGSNGYWDASSTTTVCGIRFYTGGHLSALRGYVYADTSNNIGFLNSGGNWRLRVVGDDYSLADGSSMRAQLYYDSNNTGYYADLNSTTYLYYLQSATTVRADSDRRLKENITPITSALSLVRQLQGCRYTRNDLADKTKVYIGMIAQDVLPIVPEVVSGSEAGKYSLGYAELVPVLNEAVKELDEIVSKQAEMFEERLSKQAAIIAKLEERLSKLLDD